MSPRNAKVRKGSAPAFQLYVGDFTTGTITMSLAEVGGYMRLLLLQWSSGSVPGDDVSALARAMGTDVIEAGQIWCKIRNKFCARKDGIWINSRLENERKKQDAFRKSQSLKGKKSAKARSTAVAFRLNSGSNPKATLQSSPSGSNTPLPPKGGRKRKGEQLRAVVSRRDQRQVEQAEETQRRRQEMTDAGMSDAEIESVFEREYEERKRA